MTHQRAENLKYIHKYSNKCKAVWNIIKNYTTPDFHSRSVEKLIVDNNHIEDPQKIAECFNHYFINSVVNNVRTKNCNDIDVSNCDSTIYLNPLSPNELIKVIKTLKNSKAVGHDGIRTDIIKQSMFLIAEPLTHVLNLSLMQGSFPEILKKSVVRPLYKKGDRSEMSNYRPVTLIPIFSKIYEKIMYNRLIQFLESKNVLDDQQHGFRKSRCTSLATFKLMKSVLTAIDEHIPVTVLFMDMSKAFDFVSHERLLTKVYRYGIRGPALDWIRDYLTDRCQCVETLKYCPKSKNLASYKSTYVKNNYGVPQGSILGPLLFLLYINDLPKYLSQECILFADDTSIIIKCKDISRYNDDINRTLAETIKWLHMNNLKVNLNKTNYMQFHTDRGNSQNLSIFSENDPIEEVHHTRFLGIIIDCYCNWQKQVDNVCSRISSFIYALRRIARTVSIQAALVAYHGYVDSILRYGVVLWGNSTERDQVFLVQKRCIRAIFGMEQLDSCRPIFIDNGILTFPCLYILEASLFVHKYKTQFMEIQQLRPRQVREQYKHKLYKPAVKLALSSKNAYCMCIAIYNKLPDMFKECGFNKFKNLIKQWLLQKCYYSIKDFLNDT